MRNSKSSGSKIASNTLLLYFRMIFLMGINLYTSRIVLDVLGVVDFGIYNVVGGMVILFSFLNNSMSAATQRFLSFELGKKNKEKLNIVFNNALLIHLIIGILIIVIAEVFGDWLITKYLVIPENRIYAAKIIYQTSLFLFFIKVIQVPFSATIIAHEKMNFYAYISILEGFLLLLMVFIIQKITYDKLILYGIVLLCIALVVFLTYYLFTRRNFKETKLSLQFDLDLLKKMLTFSGWSLFGGLSFVAKTQGVNMLLNVFFTPTVNAARGIAVQVQAAVQSFVLNFQTAVKPQIIKTYANNEKEAMMKLIFLSSKYSFYLLLILSLPLLIELDFVLNLWLKEVPDLTKIFTFIILIELLFDSFSGPLMTGIQATGKIKKYQIIIGSILLLNFPLSYLALKIGYPPYAVFVVSLFVTILASLIRILLLHNMLALDMKKYFFNIIIKSLLVGIITGAILWFLSSYLSPSFGRLILTITLSTILISIGIIANMSKWEKTFIKAKLQPYFSKIK